MNNKNLFIGFMVVVIVGLVGYIVWENSCKIQVKQATVQNQLVNTASIQPAQTNQVVGQEIPFVLVAGTNDTYTGSTVVEGTYYGGNAEGGGTTFILDQTSQQKLPQVKDGTDHYRSVFDLTFDSSDENAKQADILLKTNCATQNLSGHAKIRITGLKIIPSIGNAPAQTTLSEVLQLSPQVVCK